MKLEELARTSSVAARTSVSHLEPPTIGERRPLRLVGPILAGAAVTALVVGGLALLARDDADAPATTPTLPVPTELPRLGVEAPGWDVEFVHDATADGPAGGLVDGGLDPSTHARYFGEAGTDRPFVTSDLLILSSDGTDDTMADGDAVTVRGVTGTLSTLDDTGLGADGTTLMWTEPGGLQFVMASHALDGSALVRIADGLVVDVVTGDVQLGPDTGLDLIATVDGLPFQAFREPQDHLVAYSRNGGVDSLVLTARFGSLASESFGLEWWAGPGRSVDIAGQPGVVYDLSDLLAGDDGDSRILLWAPTPGVIASLVGSTAGEELDLVAIASTAFEIDDETWATYVAAAETPDDLASTLDVVYGSGNAEWDGMVAAWSLGEQDGQLCFNLSVGTNGTSSCQELVTELGDGQLAALVIQGSDGETVEYSVVAADPSVDDLRPADQALARFEWSGLAWFVAIGPIGTTESFDYVIDGQVAGRVDSGMATQAVTEPVTTGEVAPEVTAPPQP